MIRIADHIGPDGRVDWDAYRAAQRANGDRCFVCGATILFGPGHLDRCNACKALDEDRDEVTHDDFVRCPKCRHTMNVREEYDLFQDGTHELACDECGHEFEVTTVVSYSFRSPELLPDADADADADA
jgi:DNA-directed RNA polymerase subunit RPC12/RpoP